MAKAGYTEVKRAMAVAVDFEGFWTRNRLQSWTVATILVQQSAQITR